MILPTFQGGGTHVNLSGVRAGQACAQQGQRDEADRMAGRREGAAHVCRHELRVSGARRHRGQSRRSPATARSMPTRCRCRRSPRTRRPRPTSWTRSASTTELDESLRNSDGGRIRSGSGGGQPEYAPDRRECRAPAPASVAAGAIVPACRLPSRGCGRTPLACAALSLIVIALGRYRRALAAPCPLRDPDRAGADRAAAWPASPR